MPFPTGRVGTTQFFRMTGLSKTVFFQRYRNDPVWIERLDIRVDDSGRLSMCEAAALKFGVQRTGTRPKGRSVRATPLYRDCPWCAEAIRVRAVICKHCQRDVSQA
jgi:hypothetical protein